MTTEIEIERDRLRACLQDIHTDHARQTATWQHSQPTKQAQHWHDGYVTACATHAIRAKEALDPEGAAEDERMIELAARGTDAEYYAATGHCGSCGTVATNCECDGKCGCFRLHGPRKEPYMSPAEKVARVQALAEEWAEHTDDPRACAAARILDALGVPATDDPLPLVVEGA